MVMFVHDSWYRIPIEELEMQKIQAAVKEN